MNKYIGKMCPYCKSIFTEMDEIVICSACYMPHHKECWIDNKGCTTFGCSGTIQGIDFEINTNISSAPKYEVRDYEQSGNVPAFCTRCGKAIVANNAFCSQCGSPIAGELNAHGNKEIKSVMGEFQTNAMLDAEIVQYIGSKKEYYLSEFSNLKQKKTYTSWNWAAFLIPPFWCMYRKMYIIGAVILFADFLLALIGGFFSSILTVTFAFVVGLFANYFYMYDLEKRILKGKTIQGNKKIQFIDQYGDVNATVPLVVAVMYVLICVIIFCK